jgi:hypothetical protein
MDLPVAFPTEGDEVLLGIVPQLTSRSDVVDFQPDTGTARLTAPPVPLQH